MAKPDAPVSVSLDASAKKTTEPSGKRQVEIDASEITDGRARAVPKFRRFELWWEKRMVRPRVSRRISKVHDDIISLLEFSSAWWNEEVSIMRTEMPWTRTASVMKEKRVGQLPALAEEEEGVGDSRRAEAMPELTVWP